MIPSCLSSELKKQLIERKIMDWEYDLIRLYVLICDYYDQELWVHCQCELRAEVINL